MTTNNTTKTKETKIEITEDIGEISLFTNSETALQKTGIDTSPLLFPKIQPVRGNGKCDYGYFISLENLIKSEWLGSLETQDLIEYKFETEKTEEGLIFQDLKMLVYEKSPLLAYDRAQSLQQKETIIIGAWDKETHSKDSNAGNLQFYQVILLDSENNPLHKIPFSYKAKGANQATFAAHWQKLIAKITFFYCLENKKEIQPQPFPFNSLCVFAFKCSPKKTETKEQAIALKITEHKVPTATNWKNYYLGEGVKVWGRETIAISEGKGE